MALEFNPPAFNAELFSMINKNRCAEWQQGELWDSMDWAGCICGEAGEAHGFGKKMRRMSSGMVQNQVGMSMNELKKEYLKELADVVIYADLAASQLGANLWDEVRAKFNETSDRNGFNHKV